MTLYDTLQHLSLIENKIQKEDQHKKSVQKQKKSVRKLKKQKKCTKAKKANKKQKEWAQKSVRKQLQ